jgi:hypothetical protein
MKNWSVRQICCKSERRTWHDSFRRRYGAHWAPTNNCRFLIPLDSQFTIPSRWKSGNAGTCYCTMHLRRGTLEQPSSAWRFWSSLTMFNVGALCRAFLFCANTTEVKGQETFLKLLELRRDYNARTRGLITGMCRTLDVFSSIQSRSGESGRRQDTVANSCVSRNSFKSHKCVRTYRDSCIGARMRQGSEG